MSQNLRGLSARKGLDRSLYAATQQALRLEGGQRLSEIAAEFLVSEASLIGAGLKWRLSPAAAHPVIDNLNTRIKAWWAMILLIGTAIWAGKGGVIALFALISFQSLREFISLTHTRLGDHRAEGGRRRAR